MFGASNTCVKLQSRVTSSGAILVSLIFLPIGGLGADEISEFSERAGGAGACCMEHFVFWIF